MATMGAAPMVLNQDEQRVSATFVSSNYFSELGGSAATGRLFDAARDDSASAPVCVLSFRLWQRKFDGDPSIVGKAIRLGGKPATVIGVASEAFANLGTDDPDIWLPLLQHSYFVEGSKPLADPKFEGLIGMWGRLAPGVSRSSAEQELLSLTNQLRKIYPTVIWDHEYIVITPGAHFFSLEGGAGHTASARACRAIGVPDSRDCLCQSRRVADGARSGQAAGDPASVRPWRSQVARLSPTAY